ncbi:MAG: hypothetical protein K0R10_359 [Alphaproteobacteria bacterium]|jgi:hypothetical protein|nr:hypothetical protein [Alphaproteobacteria bacterium]
MSKKPQTRPMGIMASFSNVAFKKDGTEVFSARVHSGGCFGPDATEQVIDRGYAELNEAIKSGTLPETARDFNSVSVGANEYTVTKITPTHVEASKFGKRNP